MHVTACLAGQKVDVEVGEGCRTLQALRESIVVALPQLCVEGFDVSVGGRALDDDEGVVSLQQDVCLDVSANSRGLSVLALREAGREVSEAGLLRAVSDGDVALVTLYLDAGVPVDCVDADGFTPLLLTCENGHVDIARLLLDRGSTAIDEKNDFDVGPLHLSCYNGHLDIATLLLDRGSAAIDGKECDGNGKPTPLLLSCSEGHLEVVRLLLDRGSTAIDEKDCYNRTPLLVSCENGDLSIATLLLDRGASVGDHTPLGVSCETGQLEIARLLVDRGAAIDEKDSCGETPLLIACRRGHVEIARLLLDRGCHFDVKESRSWERYSEEVLGLLLERGHDVLHDSSPESAKRRRIGEQSCEPCVPR